MPPVKHPWVNNIIIYNNNDFLSTIKSVDSFFSVLYTICVRSAGTFTVDFSNTRRVIIVGVHIHDTLLCKNFK